MPVSDKVADQMWDDGKAIVQELCDAKAEINTLGAENLKLRAAIQQIAVGGNHLASYAVISGWPHYKLDGLTREQQCEHALRSLGAGWRYDMWCCWSAIMQARDAVDASSGDR